MAFVKRDVKDRLVQYPRRYQLVEVQPGIFDLVPAPGTITEPGTPINKAYLQPIEDGLADALEKTGDGKGVTVTFTEAAAEAHIASGESLAVMFGKILKKFKSIVPITLGGTGASTVAGARNNLGLGNTAGALPVANGGTGAANATNARTNLGVPPTSHASTGASYGLGTAANYGHVKIINSLTQSSYIDGTALSANQGKALKDLIDIKEAVSGSFTGTGSSQTFNIGFTPVAVIIIDESDLKGYYGLAVTGSSHYGGRISIVSNGFSVSGNPFGLNGKVCNYVAFR